MGQARVNGRRNRLRSVLLTCAAILVLGLSAFAYLWFQPTSARRPKNKILVQSPASRPQSTTKISGLGTVDQAWIIRIDPKTGEIASRFRGDRYDPQPDNTVLVDRPEAEFYASQGKQRFHVTGRSGRVYVSGVAANQKPGQFVGKMEPPSRGQLHDVVITMFE